MIFNYPMIVHEEDGYWGEFPYVEGCNAQGGTIDELLEDAKEALELHLLSMLENEEILNRPTNPTEIKISGNSFITIISADVNLSKESKSVRKTLTIPKWLNDKAEKNGVNFSQSLQKALIQDLCINDKLA